MNCTKMTLNCRNICEILQVLIKFQPSNRALPKKVYRNKKSDFCKLCLTENHFILNDLEDIKLLNKKSEFVNKCRHQNKLLLDSVLCKDSMD